jgi:hypothetical protein
MNFKNVDRIFVISVSSAYERREVFKKNNPELVSLNIFEWLYVYKENEPGMTPLESNFTNHQKIIKISKDRNYNTVMIFEDDATPILPFNKIFNYINNLVIPDTWTYIMLGYLPIKTKKSEYNNLLSVKCAYDTHAYMANVNNIIDLKYDISCPAFDLNFCNCVNPRSLKVMGTFENDIKIGKTYAFYPMLYYQDVQKNSITEENQNHFFNFYGKQVGNDTSAIISTHINTIGFITCIFIIVFIFIVILFFKYIRT